MNNDWRKELNTFLEDKKILIIGYGMEGKSAYGYIRKHFPEKKVYISDKFDISVNKELNNEFTELIIGENYLENLDTYDLILKSPGVKLHEAKGNVPYEKIYSQIDLFLQYFPGITIGITGSKGKSTTTSLLQHVLDTDKRKAFLLGNVGVPVFDEIDNMNSEDIGVIELSSFALEYINHPTTYGVLTNIYTAHIDYHKTKEAYINAKLKLFENMKKAFPNENLKSKMYIHEITEMMKESGYDFSQMTNVNEMNVEIPKMSLRGEHNIKNAKVVKVIAKNLGYEEEYIDTKLQSFKGLEHRLEHVETINGIEYINDSIATIPESTINALKAIPEAETLILGGDDKEMDPQELIDYINNKTMNLKNLILLPDSGHRIEKEFNDKFHIVKVNNMQEAVLEAYKCTKNGACVLSPAARSYGYFKSFVDRGNQFKMYVRELLVNK